MRIGIIGATGAFGQELVANLGDWAAEGGRKLDAPLLFATNRSAGEVFPWVGDEELVVEEFSADDARGLDAVIVATPEAAAKEAVAKLRELGVVAIDASRAHRAAAPIFVAERPMPIAGQPVVALPSAEALMLARVVAALLELRPVTLRATVLKAASGAGQAGVTDLAEGTGRLLNGQEPETPALGHRLAFNLVPQAGAFSGESTEAEADLARELPRLTTEGLRVASTIAWAPWFYGHFATVALAFEARVSPDDVRARLKEAAGVKLVDQPADAIYPMPSLATGDDAVLVGRVRADALDPRGVELVVAMDNVRASAANALAALDAVLRARGAH